MTWGAVAIGGATLVGGMLSSKAQSSAASSAADAQSASAQAGIAQQQAQFAAMQKLLAPYAAAGAGASAQAATPGTFNSEAYLAANPDVAQNAYWSQRPYEHWTQHGKGEGRADPGLTGGTEATSAVKGSLSAQQDLLGLNGNGAYQTAIDGIQNGAQFQSMKQQGENSILANASATGGLRGGNTQGALAQFSPALLSQLIDSQYSKLGGLTTLGQNAAAGVGNAGMSTGNNISNLHGQIGSAQAGNALAQGRSEAGYANAITGGLGAYMGAGGKLPF